MEKNNNVWLVCVYKLKNHNTFGVLPMKETYTYQDALIQFLYHEMPAEQAADMVQAIEDDPAINAEFFALRQAKTKLPKVQFNPSTASIHNILQYSTKTALEAQL